VLDGDPQHRRVDPPHHRSPRLAGATADPR
jgi:hypothetical protein